MEYVVRFMKARGRLVPVKRMVTKRGKPYLQTFYVNPNKAPKAPDKPKMIAAPDTKQLAAPKDQWTGPLGDERVYMRIGDEAIRVPEDAIHSRVTRHGLNFVIHRSYSVTSEKFMQGWQVTEATTGTKVAEVPPGKDENDPEAAKAALDAVFERHKPEYVRERVADINRMQGIASIPTEKFDDSYKPTIQPAASATDDDIRSLAEHIFTNVLDRGTPEEGELDAIIEWIENTGDYTTDRAIDDALNYLDDHDEFKMDIAIRYQLDLDDAEAIADDLEKILEYTSEYRDTVMDWYDRHYDGAQFDANFMALGTYSDYGNEWSDAMVMEFALENDVSIESAQSVAEESTESDDVRDEGIPLQDVRDSQGNLWTTEELETMTAWMGGDVNGPRNHGREADRSLREGDTPTIYNDVANLFMKGSVELPYKALYRGSPNPVWAEIQPGQKYECGFASFTKSEEFAGTFHRARRNDPGYDRFIIVCEAPEGESLYGIDLHDIGENLRDYGVENETFDAYQREEEVTLRAPSLEVTRTADEMRGVLKTRYIYVKPADMDLVEMLKSQFGSLNERVWESFNEPLGKPRRPWRKDESDTIPTPES